MKKTVSINDVLRTIVFLLGGLLLVLLLFNVKTKPYIALNGAVWFNSGPHYIDNSQIDERIRQMNAPLENEIANNIKNYTPRCDDIDEGFCERSKVADNDEISYAEKVLVIPAVEYKPGKPSRKEITGYCTLCTDNTFSPSCAVGRGACSWHGGVSQYNVPQYVTTLEAQEVAARPAIYTFNSKTVRDSGQYSIPNRPSLASIINFKK
jgi:hypothetical protein